MSQLTDELLTPDQVAAELQLHPDTIYRYISSKKIQAIKLSAKNLRIRRSELDRFLQERESDKNTD